jgi:hypothetical protein
MNDINARYDRYADIFDNPETVESIELGNRVLHWSFMENDAGRSVGRRVVIQHAKQALGLPLFP